MKHEIYIYDVTKLAKLLSDLFRPFISAENFAWLNEKAGLVATEKNAAQLNLAFAAMSRKTGREIISLSPAQQNQLEAILPGFSVNGWPMHRLCRTWILLQVNAADGKDSYKNKIEGLFRNAEMNELADLYAALPVFTYPEIWTDRCAEGIRSNIGIVLEAVMYENPYPARYLDEAAWNQMVMRAFFTDKDVNRIIGMDERVNANLAATVFDYVHERWAAKRQVNNQLWRLVGPFIDENNFPDIQRIAGSENNSTRKAAALACTLSDYAPAKKLLDTLPNLKTEIADNILSWKNLNS